MVAGMRKSLKINQAGGEKTGGAEKIEAEDGPIDGKVRHADGVGHLAVFIVSRPEGALVGHKYGDVKKDKDRAGNGFDDWIARGNGLFAVAAFAREHDPAENGDIVVPRQGMLAGRAARAGVNQRLSARQAVDHDIKKAADAGAEGEEKRGCKTSGASKISFRTLHSMYNCKRRSRAVPARFCDADRRTKTGATRPGSVVW